MLSQEILSRHLRLLKNQNKYIDTGEDRTKE